MLEAGTDVAVLCGAVCQRALGWSIIPALFVGVLLFMGYGLVRRCSLRRDGEPCGRQRTVRGDRGGGLRAHRRTDLAVAGQRDHRLHSWPIRPTVIHAVHGDSAVVSTVLGDVGAGRVVVTPVAAY